MSDVPFKVGRQWGCGGRVFVIPAAIVLLYAGSVSYKTALRVQRDVARHPDKYEGEDPGKTVENAGWCGVMLLADVSSDANRLWNNLARGDIGGAYMAAVDSLNPFSTMDIDVYGNERRK